MELEGECLATGPAEDSETISSTNSEKLGGSIDENKVAGSENRVNEHNDESMGTKGKGTEVTEEAMTLPAVVVAVKSTPAPTSKGYGLKKWRRIKREVGKEGDSNIDSSNLIMKRGLSISVKNSAKDVHYSAGTSQQSKGTVSSTNEYVKNPRVIDNLVAVHVPPFMAGADSGNSEGQSSKSSTAASASNMRNENPIVELTCDRTLVNLNGNNLGNSVQKGQQRKSRIESSKKPRGERVKIEKENTHSSMESDSRSSNFFFVQGTSFPKSNESKGGRPMNYDGQHRDEDQDCEGKVNNVLRASNNEGNSGQFADVWQEGLAAESSWEAKDKKCENQGTSTDRDPVIESIFKLQAAKEALEREVKKFKEIGKEDILVDFSHQDGSGVSDFTSIGLNHGPSTSEQLQSGDGMQGSFDSLDLETELENLFKQKIEAEVELLVSKTAAVDQITLLEEQKALASEQTQMVNKLGDAGQKAAMLKKEAEKLESYCKNMVSTADDTLKLQKSVFKHTFCFFTQLILLVIVVGLFIFQLSPHHLAEVVPT